jgi:hypothetical protein
MLACGCTRLDRIVERLGLGGSKSQTAANSNSDDFSNKVPDFGKFLLPIGTSFDSFSKSDLSRSCISEEPTALQANLKMFFCRGIGVKTKKSSTENTANLLFFNNKLISVNVVYKKGDLSLGDFSKMVEEQFGAGESEGQKCDTYSCSKKTTWEKKIGSSKVISQLESRLITQEGIALYGAAARFNISALRIIGEIERSLGVSIDTVLEPEIVSLSEKHAAELNQLDSKVGFVGWHKDLGIFRTKIPQKSGECLLKADRYLARDVLKNLYSVKKNDFDLAELISPHLKAAITETEKSGEFAKEQFIEKLSKNPVFVASIESLRNDIREKGFCVDGKSLDYKLAYQDKTFSLQFDCSVNDFDLFKALGRFCQKTRQNEYSLSDACSCKLELLGISADLKPNIEKESELGLVFSGSGKYTEKIQPDNANIFLEVLSPTGGMKHWKPK